MYIVCVPYNEMNAFLFFVYCIHSHFYINLKSMYKEFEWKIYISKNDKLFDIQPFK